MIFERKINYYETDCMGIVHHSNYIRFLEESRIFYLDELGLPFIEIEKAGILVPVLEVKCKYKYPAKFGDTILIDVKTKEFNGIHLTVEYVITHKENGNEIAIAQTKHCFTNENLRPISLKKVKPDFYDIFENSYKDIN